MNSSEILMLQFEEPCPGDPNGAAVGSTEEPWYRALVEI